MCVSTMMYYNVCAYCGVYGSIRSDTYILSWFLLSYNSFFASVWINTSLSNQALTLAPDNLLLFSLPGAVGVSEAQKRRCSRINLTPDTHSP
jgi:hypothetical protein